jgi:hypothetical protein
MNCMSGRQGEHMHVRTVFLDPVTLRRPEKISVGMRKPHTCSLDFNGRHQPLDAPSSSGQTVDKKFRNFAE